MGYLRKKRKLGTYSFLTKSFGGKTPEVLVTEKSNFLLNICKAFFDDFVYTLNVLANVKDYQLLLCEMIV